MSLTPVKRLDIIIDAVHKDSVLEALEREGINAYSIVAAVQGKGDRGERLADDLTDVFQNVQIITTCQPEQVEPITQALTPMLQRRGGVCLVSDAQWLDH